MAEKNNNWGGKREGSGRPKSKVASTITSFKLHDDLLKALPSSKETEFNRTEYFNKAIRAQMIKDGYLEPSK